MSIKKKKEPGINITLLLLLFYFVITAPSLQT